jgi:hypothetical protein
MTQAWTWAAASPAERGLWVRNHLPHCLGNLDKLCALFNLTEDGCKRILNGEDWQPEFERN